MTHPLGANPPKRDPRDWPAATVLRPTTTKTIQTWYLPTSLDQGPYGTCVPNAWTHLMMGSPVQHPDRPLLALANQPPKSAGSDAWWADWGTFTIPVAGEKYAVKLYDTIHDGVMEAKDPARTNGCDTEDGAKVLLKRGLISAYYRARTVEEVVQAILTHGPVVFASGWYRSMDNYHRAYNHSWLNVDLGSGLRGYHAYLLDAVNTAPTDGSPPWVRLHNSWGWAEGDGGCYRVSIEDLHVLFIGAAFIATEATA